MSSPTHHTPGPWTWRDGNVLTWNVVAVGDAECIPIAEIPRPDNDGHGYLSADANVRLIAAAPELLAALNALFQTACKHRWKVNSDEPDTIELARKAITLAEGGVR